MIMMKQAKKAWLEDKLHMEELDEAEDHAMEEMQEEEEGEGEMTSRSLVLETRPSHRSLRWGQALTRPYWDQQIISMRPEILWCV